MDLLNIKLKWKIWNINVTGQRFGFVTGYPIQLTKQIILRHLFRTRSSDKYDRMMVLWDEISSALKLELAVPSKMFLLVYQTIWRYIQKSF
jgi:hypothetical protein